MWKAIAVLVLIIFALLYRLCSFRVIWFYRPGCGHCQDMHSEWDEFERGAAFTAFPHVIATKVNVEEEEALAANFQVTAVPTIVRLDSSGLRTPYEGERTAAALTKWLST